MNKVRAIAEEDEIEIEEDDSGEEELEIIDDTPEDDKGKPVAEADAKDEEEEASEEEIKTYSSKVQERIKKLTAKFHQERRAKEAQLRQLEELTRAAKVFVDENNKLKDVINKGENAWKATNTSKLEALIAQATREYRDAFEAGEADKIAAAQAKLTGYQVELENTKRWTPAPIPKTQEPQVFKQPEVDHKAVDWQGRNSWFGEDQRMTAYALGVHQYLVQARKMDPTSDEYYAEIDKEMQKHFPEKFPKKGNGKVGGIVVAPANRNSDNRSRKKVTLTKTQVALAKKFGLTPQEYAAEVLKGMNND